MGITAKQYVDNISDPTLKAQIASALGQLGNNTGNTADQINAMTLDPAALANLNALSDAYRTGSGANLSADLAPYYQAPATSSLKLKTPTDPYQAALQMMDLSTQLNRFDQNTPTGSSTWSNDGNGHWTLNQTLTPDQKSLLDLNTGLSKGLLSGLNANMPGMFGALNGIDQSTLPAMPQNAGQTTQDALMSRLEPIWNRQHNQLNTNLVNQGINVGSEAWKNSQDDFNRGQNDAYLQAGMQGVNADMNARNQAISNQIALTNQPINAFNALRTGNQAATPSFNNSTTIAPADLSGAWNAQTNYNLGQQNLNTAQSNANTAGLFGLGSAFLSNYKW